MAVEHLGDAADNVTIVGRNDLTERYTAALELSGIESEAAPDDVVAMGHFLIARSAGLVS